MTANAFDTLEAAKSLKAAGFDEAQAEAVVATVSHAVRAHTAPLASSIAAIADRMATKDEVATVADSVATVADRVATISSTMATKDDVATMATKGEVATLADKLATISETMATKEYVKAAIAVEMKTLYRHLWVMGTSFVGVTVALVKLLP